MGRRSMTPGTPDISRGTSRIAPRQSAIHLRTRMQFDLVVEHHVGDTWSRGEPWAVFPIDHRNCRANICTYSPQSTDRRSCSFCCGACVVDHYVIVGTGLQRYLRQHSTVATSAQALLFGWHQMAVRAPGRCQARNTCDTYTVIWVERERETHTQCHHVLSHGMGNRRCFANVSLAVQGIKEHHTGR